MSRAARRVRRADVLRLLCAFAVALAATAAAALPAVPPTPPAARGPSDAAQVLVISGSDPYLPAFVLMDATMRDTVARQGQAVNWLYESLDAMRFGTPDASLAEAFARKYEGVRLDAILLVTEPAVEFYQRHGARLWPGVPALHQFVSPAAARALQDDAKLPGLAAQIDYAQALRIAFALQPAARRLLIVGGVSPWEQRQLAEARRAAETYAGRAAVEVVAGQSPEALARRLAALAPETIVLFVTVLADADKRVYVSRAVVARLAAASAVPIYGAIDTYMGMGMTAGAVESYSARGQRVGELVLRALGAAAGAPADAEPPPSRCVADVRQLARYRLDRARLPADCELRYDEPSLLRRYWWQALMVAAALAGQALLIAALLLQRRRRRAAEMGYAAQRTQLLHAARLAVAGELTASIAHEINQPLGAILSNADAAEMLLQAGRAEREELLQILADIKRDDLRASEVIKRLRALLARHEVERRHFDMHRLLTDTAAMLGAEARRRSAVVDTALGARHAFVNGDRVQLQQVVINLILNALDASAGLPSGERRVIVSTEDAAAGLRICVRDFGSGIAPDDLPRVFESFFSTKRGGMGLGLAIARSIVEAHGGTIVALPASPGAEFRVTLPTARDEADASEEKS